RTGVFFKTQLTQRIQASPAARRCRDVMRNRRAYLASFGTGGSLVAGAALVFILASAFVAFNGWPAVGATPSTGSVLLHPARGAGAPAARRLAALTLATPPARG